MIIPQPPRVYLTSPEDQAEVERALDGLHGVVGYAIRDDAVVVYLATEAGAHELPAMIGARRVEACLTGDIVG